MHTVLLATDFSDGSRDVIGFARGLPALGVKRVVLAHVVDSTGLEGPVILSEVDEARGQLREQAGALEETGLFVEARIPTGDPQQELLALAHEMQVDGIVCASHGRGLVDQLFLGSVSDRIVRDSAVPRLVVRYDLLRNESDPAGLCRRFGSKLLLATDFSAAALRAFQAALDLPEHSIGTMYLVHAIDPALTGERLRKAEDGAEFQLKNWCEVAREQGISAKAVIGVASAAHTVLSEADSRRVTGIVVGTRRRTPLQEALLGSVSMTLLRQASCPVMVVS